MRALGAGGADDGGDAVLVEDIGIATTAADFGDGIQAEGFSGLPCDLHHGRVIGQGEAAVGGLDFGIGECRAVLFGGVREAHCHVGDLVVKLLLVMAAGLGEHGAKVRDNVARLATLDDADVCCGLVIYAAEPHAGDGLRGDVDGVDACLGTHTGVGGLALDPEGQLVGGGRGRGHACGLLPAIEDVAVVRADLAVVEMQGAIEAGLLGDAEDHLELAVRDVGLDDLAQGVEDDVDAGLRVRAEDGVAGAGDVGLADEGLDALARCHGIHVGLEHEGRAVGIGGGEPGDEVADLAANGLVCVVELHREAHVGELRSEGLRHAPLFEGEAVHADEFAEFVGHCLALNHGGDGVLSLGAGPGLAVGCFAGLGLRTLVIPRRGEGNCRRAESFFLGEKVARDSRKNYAMRQQLGEGRDARGDVDL